jgi:penicillin-binding protein 1C
MMQGSTLVRVDVPSRFNHADFEKVSTNGLGSVRGKTVIIGAIVVLVGVAYYLVLPQPLFDRPYSTVLESRDGQLLSASIASDGQWRFPADNDVPDRFVKALLAFEDKRFFYHPGVDPFSIARALLQNVREGRIVSGGSTISMQVIRLSRGSPPRTIFEKALEMVLATRLELSYSKKEILALYAAHAPFGGNVVGLEAACWRYFGRSPDNLSWAEAATLAVLPNSPSLIHPGRNRDALRRKRDNLLHRLYLEGAIDSLAWALGTAEPVPTVPRSLPRYARHLLGRIQKKGGRQQRTTSTIDFALQRRVEEKVQQHHRRLRANQINNAAVLVLDVETGNVLAYAGNVYGNGNHGEEVDIVAAPRSTGSVLKPILYAAALNEGQLLPKSLLPDIPVRLNGFAPENFSREYDGAVPADEALVRSLNVPSVFMLKEFRYEKFHSLLRNIGFSTLPFPADHYGLALILGGAEGTLWDVTGIYASMARTLNKYFDRPGVRRYCRSDFHSPRWTTDERESDTILEEYSWLSAASIHQTFEALTALYRPAEEAGWRMFSSSRKIAWKTGTSFGFRDGWAVGVTPEYAVGVWVGNADGEGRAGLTGVSAAAPLLFDVFSMLPPTSWFGMPHSEMREVEVCRESGHRVGRFCPEAQKLYVTVRGLESPACSYHRMVHLSPDEHYRQHAECASPDVLISKEWFVLPPVQEHYYRKKRLSYKPLPPLAPGCTSDAAARPMAWVYPQPRARIYIPRDFEGKSGESVFELAHRDEDAVVYWHLDGAFIGETKGIHRLAVRPTEGVHTLTAVDGRGYSLEVPFTVLPQL